MAKLSWPLQFSREYPGPLDDNMVFSTMTDLNEYLANSALKYSGQVVTVEENPGKIYILVEQNEV